MPATLSVDQASTQFLRLVDFVSADKKAVTILRHGRPAVRIVPIPVYRTTEPDPRMSGSISHADLFADDSADWENAACWVG